jgi:RimJ/RimL family protein N-acetyltransferase
MNPTAMVPLIETEHLILRGHRIEDLSDCTAMWGNPDVVRYIGGRPYSGEEVWARLLRYVGHWHWMGFGFWAIEEKASGLFAGEVGFAEFKRELEPALQGIPEIGWVLAPHVQGKGYATEAVRAVVAWGDQHFESSRTICLIHPENLRSIRVADKCGYRELYRTAYKGQATTIFERQFDGNSVG